MLDINKSLELEPCNAYAYINRGELKFSLCDYQGALEDYNEAIEIDPSIASAYSGRAIVRQKLGDTTGSDSDFKIYKNLNEK